MPDRFASFSPGLDAPASEAFAITPSDSDDLAEVTRALYVGQGGDLVVEMATGVEVTFAAVPSGALLPLRVIRVKTASTASQIVGLC
ncbi:MAG: spike base protein, RCAP_Rcc01079 family [Devosia sp.]|jgi:hypothetical protein|nr:hypothetical protein [Devosiaceae bacterium]